MDKVWFKLRQTHYPPGPEDVILAGDGNDTDASICLGHCITHLKRIDFPINRGKVLPFPPRMKVFPASSLEFKWHDERSTSHGVNLGIGAPVAAALGLLTVKGGIKLAFRRSNAVYEKYERLDTYFVQPTKAYIEECVESEALQKHIADKSSWSFFMITGIRVARKGSKITEEKRSIEVEAGPEVDVPGVITVEATGNAAKKKDRKIIEREISDFVWAVRLAKVHKGILMTDWSIDPYTHRATFAVGDSEEVDVEMVVKDEGIEKFRVVEDDELGEAFVIEDEDWIDLQ